MEVELLLSFLGAAILLTVMPGPDNIFVLTESITKGHRNGVAVSLGLCCGIFIHTMAAATGVSIIIQKSAMAFSILKYVGAAYLFYLAWQAYKEKTPIVDLKLKQTEQKSFLQLVRKGLLMNVLNPKVSLFFIALLPQFVSHNGFSVVWQMILLGAIFMLQALIIFSLISMLSGRLSGYLNKPRFWRVTNKSKVVVLSVLGLTLALARK